MSYHYLSQTEQRDQIIEILKEYSGSILRDKLIFEIYRRISTSEQSDEELIVIEKAFLSNKIQLADFPYSTVNNALWVLMVEHVVKREKDSIVLLS